MATSFEKRIKELQREILELKTAQQLSPRVRSYSKSFTIGGSASQYPNGHGRITYEAGDGDILTGIISDISVWASAPTDTTQEIYLLANTGSAFQNAPIFVMSTRPIAKIEMLD